MHAPRAVADSSEFGQAACAAGAQITNASTSTAKPVGYIAFVPSEYGSGGYDKLMVSSLTRRDLSDTEKQVLDIGTKTNRAAQATYAVCLDHTSTAKTNKTCQYNGKTAEVYKADYVAHVYRAATHEQVAEFTLPSEPVDQYECKGAVVYKEGEAATLYTNPDSAKFAKAMQPFVL